MGRYEDIVREAKSKVTEISPADAANKVESGAAVLIDVREKEEWDEARIPKAIHVSRGRLEGEIEDRVSDPNASIIVHCGGGGRSALAAETLQRMGYKNVMSLSGGLKAWKKAGLPTEK